MNIGARLEAVAKLVPQGCVLADIGTDHAYLPVWLLQKGQIKAAVAADIAAGPCRAAQTNIGMYGLRGKIEVRMGSGLTVLKPGEADGAVIAGMGGSTQSTALGNLRNALGRLRRELELPETLAQAGVDPRAVWSNTGAIVSAAMDSPHSQKNPLEPEDFLIRRVLEEVTGRV